MVDVRPKGAVGPHSNARVQAALLRDAKAYHTPSAERLAALAARLEPHLEAFEQAHPRERDVTPRVVRHTKAWGMTLPALAAAVLPYLYFTYDERPPPSPAVAQAVDVPANVSVSNTAAVTVGTCTALGACGEQPPATPEATSSAATAPLVNTRSFHDSRRVQPPRVDAPNLHPRLRQPPASPAAVAPLAPPPRTRSTTRGSGPEHRPRHAPRGDKPTPPRRRRATWALRRDASARRACANVRAQPRGPSPQSHGPSPREPVMS